VLSQWWTVTFMYLLFLSYYWYTYHIKSFRYISVLLKIYLTPQVSLLIFPFRGIYCYSAVAYNNTYQTTGFEDLYDANSRGRSGRQLLIRQLGLNKLISNERNNFTPGCNNNGWQLWLISSGASHNLNK